MDPGHSGGPQTQVHEHSPSSLPPDLPPLQSGDLTDPDKQGTGSSHQRGDNPGHGGWDRLHQPNVPCPEIGRGMEAGDQSEGPEPVCSLSPLQDGIHSDNQGPGQTGRLVAETRLEQCVPDSTYPPGPPEVSALPVARPDMAVQGASIRLSSAPLTFTKITKPVVSTLRRLGIRMSLYLDDMLLMADSVQEARAHLRAAIEILVALGFVINMGKSTFQPSQKLEFLGFCIDT